MTYSRIARSIFVSIRFNFLFCYWFYLIWCYSLQQVGFIHSTWHVKTNVNCGSKKQTNQHWMMNLTWIMKEYFLQNYQREQDAWSGTSMKPVVCVPSKNHYRYYIYSRPRGLADLVDLSGSCMSCSVNVDFLHQTDKFPIKANYIISWIGFDEEFALTHDWW